MGRGRSGNGGCGKRYPFEVWTRSGDGDDSGLGGERVIGAGNSCTVRLHKRLAECATLATIREGDGDAGHRPGKRIGSPNAQRRRQGSRNSRTSVISTHGG